MPSELTLFQDRFTAALLEPDARQAARHLAIATNPGFAVYRNTVFKGCIDALAANFPSVARLTGEEWFRSAAALYVSRHPPRDTRLLFYGEHFPAFLAAFEPARSLPYLAGVAKLDRRWLLSHTASDAQPLTLSQLFAILPEELAASVLHPVPSAQWAWFEDIPAFSIWHRNRIYPAKEDEMDWQGEGALLVRTQEGVQASPLTQAECTFLTACGNGVPFGEALGVFGSEDGADIAATLARLVGRAAFTLNGSLLRQ